MLVAIVIVSSKHINCTTICTERQQTLNGKKIVCVARESDANGKPHRSPHAPITHHITITILLPVQVSLQRVCAWASPSFHSSVKARFAHTTQQSDRKADSPSKTSRDQAPIEMHQLPPLSLLAAFLALISSGFYVTASMTRSVHAPVASSRIGAAGLWLERCQLVSVSST